MLRKITFAMTLGAIWLSAPCGYSVEETRDEATLLFELANGLYKRGPAYYGQAIIQYREFLSRHPRDERCDDATIRLGNCLRKQGKYNEALQAFLNHQKFKGSPRRDEANLRTGQVYFSLEKHPEAIQYLRKVYAKVGIDENLAGSSALWLGWAYLKNGQPKEAVPILTRLADGPENPLVPWANFHLGYAYRALEDFNSAIERFQKAATALPTQRAETLFMIAEAYANLKEYQEAYSAYKELVEKYQQSPFHGRAAFGAVWSLYTGKDYDKAVLAYSVCQKFIPKESQAEAVYILGNCYYETKKLNEALQSYRKVSGDYPRSDFAPRADYKSCWCLFLLDQFTGVISAGTAFVKAYPDYPDIANVHFLLGESFLKRNRVKDAQSQYETVVRKHPRSMFLQDASFMLGECQFKGGLLEEARSTFREFAATYPASNRASKALARAAECGLQLARKAKPKDQPARFREVAGDYNALYELLVSQDPKDPLAGDTLYQLGVTYARLNKHDDMIKAFETLVKDYPKNGNCAEAYYWLASESEKAENYPLAVERFQRSFGLKPSGPYAEQTRRRLVDVYYKKGDKEEAATLIVQMLRDNPQSDIAPQTHLWAGDFLLEKGGYTDAIELYSLFLTKFKKSPLSERAYYGLGDSYFKQENWQKAVDSFARAIEFKGEWVSLSRLSSGIALLKLGRSKEAEQSLREVERSGGAELEPKAIFWLGNMHFNLAPSLEPREEQIEQYNLARKEYIKVVILHNRSEVRPECMYRVAECLQEEGLIQESKKQLQELIQDYPNHEFAKKAREKLGAEAPSPTAQ